MLTIQTIGNNIKYLDNAVYNINYMISRSFLLVIGIIVLGWSLVGIGYADHTDRISLNEERTPVEGEIIDNEIKHTTQDDRLSPQQDIYYASATIEYEYDNEVYEFERDYTTYSSSDEEEVESFIEDNISVGEKLNLYLSPDNPENVHNNQVSGFMSYSFMTVGSILLLLTLMLVKRARR